MIMITDHQQVLLRIEKKTWENLKTRSIVSGISFNDFVNKILKNYVKRNKPKKLFK